MDWETLSLAALDSVRPPFVRFADISPAGGIFPFAKGSLRSYFLISFSASSITSSSARYGIVM